MVDPVMVEAYGADPVNQLGTITVPEPRMVLINVWDKAWSNAVDKAIRNSGLGINRRWTARSCACRSPNPNEERRREARQGGRPCRAGAVAVRNVRRDGMDQLKRAKAAGMAGTTKIWSDEIGIDQCHDRPGRWHSKQEEIRRSDIRDPGKD